MASSSLTKLKVCVWSSSIHDRGHSRFSECRKCYQNCDHDFANFYWRGGSKNPLSEWMPHRTQVFQPFILCRPRGMRECSIKTATCRRDLVDSKLDRIVACVTSDMSACGVRPVKSGLFAHPTPDCDQKKRPSPCQETRTAHVNI
jgi:hypothetical protein